MIRYVKLELDLFESELSTIVWSVCLIKLLKNPECSSANLPRFKSALNGMKYVSKMAIGIFHQGSENYFVQELDKVGVR